MLIETIYITNKLTLNLSIIYKHRYIIYVLIKLKLKVHEVLELMVH